MKIIVKAYMLVRFISIFLWLMCVANFRVAYFILMPHVRLHPGVIAYPMKCESNVEVTLLAIIVSLTPGTFALDVSDDKKYMYLHTMFTADKEAIIDEIRDHLEKPLMNLLSWK